MRQTGASAETAKEVKIFGLHTFLNERYRFTTWRLGVPLAAIWAIGVAAKVLS